MDTTRHRAVIEGVPRVAFAPIHDGEFEFTPFPSCLKAVARALGRNLAYHYLLGASGAAFRLVWHQDRWEGGNVDIVFMDPDPLAPARRAIAAAGMTGTFLLHSAWVERFEFDEARRLFLEPHSSGDEEEFRARIVRSIDAGVPVIAFGVVGPPEACIVAGYDDDGRTLIGWSMFQDDEPPPDHDATQAEDGFRATGFEDSGYFRRHDWFRGTWGIVTLEVGSLPQVDVVYREALERLPSILSGPSVYRYHTGRAAYDAYIAAMGDDAQFEGLDRRTLGLRKMAHYDAMTMIAERGQGGRFVREMAARDAFAPARYQLEAAADHFESVVRQMVAWWQVVGRIWDDEEAQVRATANPAVRRAFLPYIVEARDHDAKALKHVLAALSDLGIEEAGA